MYTREILKTMSQEQLIEVSMTLVETYGNDQVTLDDLVKLGHLKKEWIKDVVIDFSQPLTKRIADFERLEHLATTEGIYPSNDGLYLEAFISPFMIETEADKYYEERMAKAALVD